MNKIFEITPVAQNYHWGKKGADSLISSLIPSFDPNLNYAELWFGAHPKAPASIPALNEKSLAQLISEQPNEILGADVAEKFGQLPFLFKVLSIDRALSIQAHPDLALAKSLHLKDPKNYPDNNHKPEIAIALSEFWLLSGFRQLSEIQNLFRANPLWSKLIATECIEGILAQQDNSPETQELFKQGYSQLLRSSKQNISEVTDRLIAEIAARPSDVREKFLLDFHADYGSSDVGILSSQFLNLVCLQPGEASAIGPNIAHAYLKGDIVECMANSDNVVRAGLSPKFQDYDTLIEMLAYELKEFEGTAPQVMAEDSSWIRYPSSAPEFSVDYCSGTHELKYQQENKLYLLFCLEGNGEILSEHGSLKMSAGKAFIVPASAKEYCLKLNDIKLFRVCVPTTA